MATTLRNILSHASPDESATNKASKRHSSSFSRRPNADESRGRMLRHSPHTSTSDRPPTPPLKDAPALTGRRDGTGTPGTPTTSSSDYQTFFRPGHLSRAGSVYSLSRVSFTSQISQLTAVRLPDASALSSSISAIPTADAASNALRDAADQIQAWIFKATEVLGGLEAGDDVEWAAAAGRQGLAEVDQAIVRFERLVDIYIAAVEELQLRPDAATVPAGDLHVIVGQVERISRAWRTIKKTLSDVKNQVELAMEHEELIDTVVGDIGVEIDHMSRMIFEMEERRHQLSSMNKPQPQTKEVNLYELETMMHDTMVGSASRKASTTNANLHQQSTPHTPELTNDSDDSNLLALFARMQPLRASLDFLPMRLSTFNNRASHIFPSASRELEERRIVLESQWAKLEADAEFVRKEVGEDRWNIVFRNAGKQAIKMIESVEGALTKVDESLGHDTHLRHSPATVKKIEKYEAKKQHLCPAIDRVLNIVERGVNDRLTVNGEIVRLRADIRQRWQTLQIQMRSMDSLLDEYAYDAGFNQQQLRDSVSTILSTAQSIESGTAMTPGSSPPSSTGLHSRRDSQQEAERPKPRLPSTNAGHTAVSTPPAQRFSSLPMPQAKTPTSRSSAMDLRGLAASAAVPSPRSSPASARSFAQRMSATPPDNRPRWTPTSKKAGGDYNVSDYYKSLMSKGASLHRVAPRQSSAPNPATPASSPLAATNAPRASQTPTPGSATRESSRPAQVRRKPSDRSLPTRTGGGGASTARQSSRPRQDVDSPRQKGATPSGTRPGTAAGARALEKKRSFVAGGSGGSGGSGSPAGTLHSRSRNVSSSLAKGPPGSDRA